MATNFKHDMTSLARARKARTVQRREEQSKVYRAVDKRDGFKCRCCGAARGPRHHHHIRFRSQGGEQSTANVVVLCASCHQDTHLGRLFISGDADAALKFGWRNR